MLRFAYEGDLETGERAPTTRNHAPRTERDYECHDHEWSPEESCELYSGCDALDCGACRHNPETADEDNAPEPCVRSLMFLQRGLWSNPRGPLDSMPGYHDGTKIADDGYTMPWRDSACRQWRQAHFRRTLGNMTDAPWSDDWSRPDQ